jgi:sec-independent protein translocase protein TatB
MLSLNPEKLFIVLIVALILLGPDKLPKLARQMGAGWSKLRAFQQRMESEVRETMPDLPSGREIARIVRSPVSYLTQLADGDGLVPDPADPANAAPAAPTFPADRAAPPTTSNGHGAPGPVLVRQTGSPAHQVPADPGMN